MTGLPSPSCFTTDEEPGEEIEVLKEITKKAAKKKKKKTSS